MSFLGKISEWFSHLVEGDDYWTVTVKRGDSLWKISEELTGSGANWTKIAAANPDRKWDKDYMIRPGEVLKVPKD